MRRLSRSRGAGAFVPLVLLWTVLVPPILQAQTDFPSGLKTISKVELKGRRHVSAKEIWGVLKTQRPSSFPWRQKPVLRTDFLEADVRAIELVYRQSGYLDTRVDYHLTSSRDDRSAIVTFQIREGARSNVKRVDFTGVHAFPIDPVAKKLYLRPGRPFNPSAMIVDTARISAAYKERGMLPRVAASAERESLGVIVYYDIEEGPVYRNGETAVTPPPGIEERLIRRELLLKPGDVYRALRVQRSVGRLYETGLFSQAQISTFPDSTNTLVDYEVRVRARRPRWIDAGVGSGTTERFRFTGEWGHRNVAGRGLQGVVSAKLAFDGQARFLLSGAEASLLEPWLLGSRTRGQISIYGEQRDGRPDTGSYTLVRQDRVGARFQLRRDFGRYAHASLSLDNTRIRQSFLYRTPEAAASDSSPTHYITRRLLLAADRDTRDDPLNAVRGSYQAASAEVAGGPLGGTSSFHKGVVSSSWYTPLRNGWVFATRLGGGVITPFGEAQFSSDTTVDSQVARVPIEDRFRIGGVNSLRGYDENSVTGTGGLAMFQANAEFRIPLIGPFGLEAFADAGNVWARPGYIKGRQFLPKVGNTRLDAGDVRYLFGVGWRVNLPFGPLRVDFAWSTRPDELGLRRRGVMQFAIGPSF